MAETIIFVGHARLPQAFAGRSASPLVSVEVEVATNSGEILNASCGPMPDLATALMRELLLGRNIANVETPGYRRQTVPFENQLRAALDTTGVPLATTRAGHMVAGSASNSTPMMSPTAAEMLGGRNDGNSVDLEQEMTDLADTTIRYYAIADALKSKLSILRQAIERS